MNSPYKEMYSDHYVDVNNLRLHYTDWNSSAEQCLFLVHGANVQLHTWDPLSAELSKTYRVIAVDLRGHGDSEWAKDGYAVSAFVSDLRGMIDALEIAPVDYIGHSLGARVGLAYAGEHPDTLRTMTLSDAGPELDREGGLAGRSIVGISGDIRGFRNEAEALALYEKLHPEWKPIFRELHATYQLRRNWAGKLVYKSDPDLFWLTGSAGARDNDYVWRMATQITTPVLFLRGKRSPFVSDKVLQRLSNSVPTMKVVELDTGHYIPREDPDEFLKLTRDFLERQSA